MNKSLLSPLDWVVFFTILIFTFAFVIYGNRRKKNADSESENYLDLILMSRKLTLPLFVATLVATWYGGIFGVTRLTYEKGIFNFVTQGVFWYFTYLIFAFFLVDRIRSSKAQTLPHLIEMDFGPKSAKIAAWMNIINVIPISYAISVGIFLQYIFGGSLILNSLIGVSLVLLYSTKGGLRAVVYSDLIQFLVMVFAVISLAIFSIGTYGLSYLKVNLPASHFSITGGESISTLLVWGVIALSTLVDPNFYQRCLAAKDSSTAKKGIIISTVVWVIFDLSTTLGALYARATLKDADPEFAYLNYALHTLPIGLRGLILAGILATIISTLDSYIFIGATTIVSDIHKSLKDKTRAHHFYAIFIGLSSVALSYFFKGNIYKVWKLFGSLSSACLLIPVLLGKLFKQKVTDQIFFIACSMGVLSIILWNIIEIFIKMPNIDNLYIGSFFSALPILYAGLFKKTNLADS